MSAVPGRPQGELRDARQGSYLTGTSARRGWIQMAAVVTLLVSALVILYAKTQSYGVSDYFENVAVLRHVKQLDAQWELDVLKSRIGISTNYDTLSDSLTELSAR